MKKIVALALIVSVITSCKKERPTLGDPPTESEASFTYVASASSPNVIEFTNNTNYQCIWDFGNETSGQGNKAVAEYPYAGTYTVKLTVFNKGGSRSSTQQVVITQDDLSLLDNPVYTLLTGGVNGIGYKTWYIDSTATGHLGVGPDPESALGPVPEWWAASANNKPGCGLYNDRYKFYLNGFKFDMITNQDVYVHNSLAGTFPGSYMNLSDYTAPYADRLNYSWFLTEGETNEITISGDAFMGMFTGVNTYRIIDITDSTLHLQYKHHSGGLLWYLKLKAI